MWTESCAPPGLLRGMSVLAIAGCAATPSDAEDTAGEFLKALGSRDVTRVESLLAPDFRFRQWNGEVMANRAEYLVMLGWDFEAGGVRTVERLQARGDTVTAMLREANRFTDLLDLRPFRVEVRFVVSDGVIAEQRIREMTPADSPSYSARFADAIGPIVEWGAREDSNSWAARAMRGGMSYNEDSARRLWQLIERYQERAARRE